MLYTQYPNENALKREKIICNSPSYYVHCGHCGMVHWATIHIRHLISYTEYGESNTRLFAILVWNDRLISLHEAYSSTLKPLPLVKPIDPFNIIQTRL